MDLQKWDKKLLNFDFLKSFLLNTFRTIQCIFYDYQRDNAIIAAKLESLTSLVDTWSALHNLQALA